MQPSKALSVRPTETNQLSGIFCCVQLIDIGTQRVAAYDGSGLRRKIIVRWELVVGPVANSLMPKTVYKTYDMSFTEGSAMRQDLESWFGDEFNDRIRRFDLKSILGKYCMLTLASSSGGVGERDHSVQRITPLTTGFNQAPLLKPMTPFGIFNISTPDMEMFERLPHEIQEQIKNSPECNWLPTNRSSSKYRFPIRHQSGTTAKYVKLTNEKYYCRINHPDGTNTFHYTYHEDPGGNEFSMSEDDYKAVRGISEQLLQSW